MPQNHELNVTMQGGDECLLNKLEKIVSMSGLQKQIILWWNKVTLIHHNVCTTHSE